MPYIDYYLTSDTDLTKAQLTESELTRSLTSKLDLGKDNRTWNKEHLKALKLLLCNAITYLNQDDNIFLYSRKKRTVPKRFNPSEVGYAPLFFVIDKLIEAEIIEGTRAEPRTLGYNPKLTSEFTITQHFVNLAISLGITNKTTKTIAKHHVRLRDTRQRTLELEFKDTEYTNHIENLMSRYCYYLNAHNIILSTENYELDTGEGIIDLGLRGQPIHLYRNYRNYKEDKNTRDEVSGLFIDMEDANFNLGGRSGSYWQGSKQQHTEDRDFILIDGKKTKSADFPCSHLNLCYRQETNDWYQTETYKELKEEGREHEDAYVVGSTESFKYTSYPSGLPKVYSEEIHRDLVKHMVMLMFNIKGRRAVSAVFNAWIERTKTKRVAIRPKPKSLLKRTYKTVLDEDNIASKELSSIWKKLGIKAIDVMNLIEKKHPTIKDYFYKGKIAGQIIQWHEANVMHHLADYFQQSYDFPVLTVFDEMIVPEEHQPMVKDFMFSTTHCEVCEKHNLMSQIKGL
ncbi:MAG: hypothetical protein ACJ0F4_02265 [Gammaproteobacteria bacterium]